MEDIDLGPSPAPAPSSSSMDSSSKRKSRQSTRRDRDSADRDRDRGKDKHRSNDNHKSSDRSKKKSSSSASSSQPATPVRRLAQKIVLDDDTDVISLLIQAFSAHRICKHVRINRPFFKKLTSEQSSHLLEAIGELPKLEIFEIDFPPREGHPLIAQALASFLKKAKKLNTITLCNLELSGETDVMIDALNNHPSLQDVKILLLQEGVPHLIHS